MTNSDRAAIAKILDTPNPKNTDFEQVFKIYFEARTRNFTREERDLLKEKLPNIVFHEGEYLRVNQVRIEIPSFLQNTIVPTFVRVHEMEHHTFSNKA